MATLTVRPGSGRQWEVEQGGVFRKCRAKKTVVALIRKFIRSECKHAGDSCAVKQLSETGAVQDHKSYRVASGGKEIIVTTVHEAAPVAAAAAKAKRSRKAKTAATAAPKKTRTRKAAAASPSRSKPKRKRKAKRKVAVAAARTAPKRRTAKRKTSKRKSAKSSLPSATATFAAARAKPKKRRAAKRKAAPAKRKTSKRKAAKASTGTRKVGAYARFVKANYSKVKHLPNLKRMAALGKLWRASGHA